MQDRRHQDKLLVSTMMPMVSPLTRTLPSEVRSATVTASRLIKTARQNLPAMPFSARTTSLTTAHSPNRFCNPDQANPLAPSHAPSFASRLRPENLVRRPCAAFTATTAACSEASGSHTASDSSSSPSRSCTNQFKRDRCNPHPRGTQPTPAIRPAIPENREVLPRSRPRSPLQFPASARPISRAPPASKYPPPAPGIGSQPPPSTGRRRQTQPEYRASISCSATTPRPLPWLGRRVTSITTASGGGVARIARQIAMPSPSRYSTSNPAPRHAAISGSASAALQ